MNNACIVIDFAFKNFKQVTEYLAGIFDIKWFILSEYFDHVSLWDKFPFK